MSDQRGMIQGIAGEGTRLHIRGLFIHPIKACRGLGVQSMPLDARGPVDDRRLLVVKPDGEFMTQRDYPRMALIEPQFLAVTSAPGLASLPVLRRMSLGSNGRAEVEFPLRQEGPRLRVEVWGEPLQAVDQGDDASRWLSDFIGERCRLVRLADDFRRPVDPRYRVSSADEVGFADGFPLLVIGQASLDDLNRRLEKPLPMTRFRPNVVVAGGEPFAEDGWRRIRAGEVELAVVKPCARCVVTTTDQETTERGEEPLRTLATYRNRNGKVMFGQNAIHLSRGTLNVGEEVVVLDQRATMSD